VYRCDLCGAVSQPRTPANRLVLSSTPTTYRPRELAHVQRDGAGKKRYSDDPGGHGHQIKREALVCATCLTTRGAHIS
jgi:hypothetical protein